MSTACACDVDLADAERIVDEFEAKEPVAREHLIPLLQRLQEAYGYLPAPVLQRVSKRTRIPTSQIYGVITFYAQFYLEPHGKHTITFCKGTSCHVRGGNKALEAVQSMLGIEDGQTTDDMLFSLETVACLGACALAPLMIIDEKYHGKLTPRSVEEVLQNIMDEEEED